MTSETKALLDRQIDDLLLDIRGSRSFATCWSSAEPTDEEITSHARALARSRARLAELIRGPARVLSFSC